ncbi:MAG: phosphatidylserine decarboxylase [Arenicella sp.]
MSTSTSKKIDQHPLLAREGWFYLFLAIVASFAAYYWLNAAIFVVFFLLALFVLQFFRDPHRAIPQEENVIVSPADGKVIFVGEVNDPYLDRVALKISVFMNVFSVHSNRSPLTGTVKAVEHYPGKFVNAALDKASEANERNAIVLEDEQGREIVSVQVAGLVARRILCYVEPGDALERGQRYGFIRFGSRVDLFLPTDFKTRVSIGDNVSSGRDILGGF